jgi:hypothetical protein
LNDSKKKPRPITAADIRKMLDGMPTDARRALIWAWMDFLNTKHRRPKKRY